jgi:Spy/CpxP family protein refolding chaperone
MRTLPARFTNGVAATLVALCASLAAASAVRAQTAPTPPEGRPPMQAQDGQRGGPGMRGGGEMAGGHAMHGPGMHMMREAARLRTSLQLNGQQAALWDRAVAAMKPQGDPRADMKARHERIAAMLDDPNFDPRRLAAEMDRAETEHRARMSSVREAWFALYDSLNPVQRGQVREFLREKMTRHEGGMHGPMGGPQHERRDAAPPAPSPLSR